MIEDGYAYHHMEAEYMKMHSANPLCQLVIIIREEDGLEAYHGPKRVGKLVEMSAGSRKRRFADIYDLLNKKGDLDMLVIGSGKELSKEDALKYLPEDIGSAHEQALNV
jgi:hypothetical protein